MSDHDNLRDRIAQIFYQVGNGVLVLNMSPNERNDLAQAIIDEFGLTVETGHITGQGYGLPGVIGKRVVGKWEKQ